MNDLDGHDPASPRADAPDMNPSVSGSATGGVVSSGARVARAAGIVSGLTLISRVLGYVRDMVVASFFGAGFASDAFFVAFSIPNLMRRLFGEGSLSIAFVPVFSDCLTRRGRAQADQLAAAAFRLLFLMLLGITFLGVIWSPAIIHLLAYGWSGDPQKFALCVHLTRIMLPYVLFIGLTALCMAILNVLDHFAAPAMAPVFLNVAMIGSVLGASLFTRDPLDLVQWLAVGVVVGGVLQLGVQMPFLIRRRVLFWKGGHLWHPELNKVARFFLPVLFGTAVYQINSVVIKFLASLLPQGSVSYLYFADRLVQFPIGVFGLAAATAVLPAMARNASLAQWDEMRKTFRLAVGLVMFVSLPAMVGLMVLREPIVALLFQRGHFDAQATRMTADALWYYAVGLWAVSIVRIVLNALYAMQIIWTPTLVGAFCVVANMALGFGLMGPLGHNGLALALSLASIINLALLVGVLRRRLGALGWRAIAGSAGASAVCALIMGVGVRLLAGRMLPAVDQAATIQLLIGLAVCIMVGVA